MATTASSNMSLAKLPPAGRVAFGAVAFALVAILYYVVFYNDVSTRITAAENQKSTLAQKLAQANLAHASYIKDKDELGTLQQNERELNKALPPDTQIAAFLSSIQQVSNVAGVNLQAWQPQDEKADTYYSKVPMKIELTGRFFQIAKFAYEVGKLERIINIENIEISDPKVEGDEIHVEARCLATTFHTPAAAAPKSAATSTVTPRAPGGK
ncbi:MAG: type 4a pilus biogenesis protein PilO [Polyangiaceae bacterium]